MTRTMTVTVAQAAPVGIVLDHSADQGVEQGVDLGGESGLVRRRNERGMVSAEWAVGILAAIAIAGVLLAVVLDGQVQEELLKFILFVINKFSGMAAAE